MEIKMTPKKIAGAIIAILIIVASYFLPEIQGLSALGARTIFLLIAYLVMLVLEVLPIIPLTLLLVTLMPLLGIVPNLTTSLVGMGNQTPWFAMASGGISMALVSTPVTKRILKALMKKFGNSVESSLLALMFATAIISAIISNVPCCAIFTVIALEFMKLYKDPAEERRAGKMYMIAIPMASMIGGMMTPAGSSLNVMAISQLEALTGNTVTFVQWMAAGIPIAVVMLLACWFLLCKIFKPYKLTKDEIQAFVATIDVPHKMDAREKKVVVLTIILFVLWVASSWISFLNTMVLAILGCAILFLPFMGVLEPKQFCRETSWDAFFLVGGVLGLSTAMVTNGVSQWIAELIPVLNVSLPFFIAIAGLVIFIALVFIPVAPSLIPVLAIPLVTMATNAAVAPTMVIVALGLCACNCYLLPLDTVSIITYSKGYYKMSDMFKAALPLQILMIVLCALWLPIVGRLVGLM